MALPLLVTTLIVVAVKLGVFKLTVNTAVVPSTTVGLEIANVGAALLSVIVPVPTAVVFDVLPEVTVPVNVNCSAFSYKISTVVGTFTVAVVCPDGIVIVVVTEVKSPVPADPAVVTISITVGNELGLLKLTVNTALPPSNTVGLEMVTVGCGSLSVMVAVPVAVVLLVVPAVTVPVAVNASVGSCVVSCVVGTLNVMLVSPAGIVTLMFVKV